MLTILKLLKVIDTQKVKSINGLWTIDISTTFYIRTLLVEKNLC